LALKVLGEGHNHLRLAWQHHTFCRLKTQQLKEDDPNCQQVWGLNFQILSWLFAQA